MTHVGQSVGAPSSGLDGRRRPRARPVGATSLAAYVGLTKPRIIELLLLTTVPVMFFAAGGVPPLGLVVATVVGGTLSAGSATALNCVYDRDIDEQMRRTRRRPLPRHIVSPRAATGLRPRARRRCRPWCCWLWVNPLSAVLALVAERLLRLRLHDAAQAAHHPEHRLGRPGRLLPGADRLDRGDRRAGLGAGGAVPVVFFWTPPHTWALALRYREDYAGADVPMLPGRSRRPPRSAGRSSLYSWVMVAASLLLWPVADTGWFYPVAAVVLGRRLPVEAHRMWAGARGTEDLARDPADAAVPLLEPLPVAALRRRRARPARHPLRLAAVTFRGRRGLASRRSADSSVAGHRSGRPRTRARRQVATAAPR